MGKTGKTSFPWNARTLGQNTKTMQPLWPKPRNSKPSTSITLDGTIEETEEALQQPTQVYTVTSLASFYNIFVPRTDISSGLDNVWYQEAWSSP